MSGFGAGSKLNMMQFQLERIERDLRQIRLEAMAQGVSPGAGSESLDPAARSRWLERKLTPQMDALRLLRRDLKSIEHGLDNRQRIAHRISRAGRWSERQSIDTTRNQSRGIFQMLMNVIGALQDLAGEGAAPSPRELSDAVANAVKDQIDFAHELSSKMHEVQALISVPETPQFVPAQQTVQNVSWDGMILAAWLLARWLIKPRRARLA